MKYALQLVVRLPWRAVTDYLIEVWLLALHHFLVVDEMDAFWAWNLRTANRISVIFFDEFLFSLIAKAWEGVSGIVLLTGFLVYHLLRCVWRFLGFVDRRLRGELDVPL